MNILQLCVRIPYPTSDGGSIAMYNMQKALYENNATLKVLSFNTIKQPVDISKLNSEYLKMTRIEGVYLDNRIKPFAALFNLFTGESYHIIRFIKRDFEEKLIDILKQEKFAIIQLESLFMIPYIETIRRFSNAKIVLRTHNIEHLIWQRLAATAKNPLRKWYLNLLTERLRNYEMWALQSIDAIVAMTKEDQGIMRELGSNVPIHLSPIGIDLKNYPFENPPENLVIFHLGAMDWIPNQEGMKWFLDKVWPQLNNDFPNVKLKFAGKKMPQEFFKFNSNICEVNEFVENPIHYMQQGRIMIVPLFSGSGMRVKIIEGMALGKAIVTTSIGIEGIPATNGKDVLIANTPLDFLNQIKYLLNNPEKVFEIGSNARNLILNQFDNKTIGKKVLDFYNDLLNDSKE